MRAHGTRGHGVRELGAGQRVQEAFAGAQAHCAVGDPGRWVRRLLCDDGSTAAGPGCGGGGSGGGEERGAGLELVVEEGGFGFDAPLQRGFGVGSESVAAPSSSTWETGAGE